MFKPSLSSLAFVALPLLAGASAAQAGFTFVGPPNGAEASHSEILTEIYGGAFAPSGTGFTNGSLSLSRVDDDLPSTLTPATLGELTDPVRYAGIFATMTVTPDGPQLFSKGNVFKSDPADNADGLDHLVVYHSPTGGKSENGDLYVLFWDDGFGDRDFNDFVIGTQMVQGPAVPLPPAVFGALLAAAPFALQQVRRRRDA